MRPFGRNFLPGPTDVRPEILQATLQDYYFGFAERIQRLIAGVQPGLQEMFGTGQPVFLSVTAATGLMEAAVRNGVRRRVLVISGGYFGEMFARVAEGCGKEVLRANVPFGQTLEPDQLAVFLEGPEVDAVALVHSESSTGALAPLEALARVVKQVPGRLLLVDGVTSVGAVPVKMDAWGVDFLFTGSQKALALPPGIAMGAASPALLERAERLDDRGWYLSATHLVGAVRKNLPLTTPALPVFHALEAQLQRIAASGGLAARIERHARMAAIIHAWAPAHGLRVVAREGRRSPTVTALELPEGKDAVEVVRAMEQRDWLIATGMAPMTERVIRIGHMGDLEPVHLEALLAELATVLS